MISISYISTYMIFLCHSMLIGALNLAETLLSKKEKSQ